MTCDDFVEAIRKYRLLIPMEEIEAAMVRREIEIAASIKSNLLKQGIDVPEIIERAI